MINILNLCRTPQPSGLGPGKEKLELLQELQRELQKRDFPSLQDCEKMTIGGTSVDVLLKNIIGKASKKQENISAMLVGY